MVKARRRRLAAGLYQLGNRYQFRIDATRNRYQQIRVLRWREGWRADQPAMHQKNVDELNERH